MRLVWPPVRPVPLLRGGGEKVPLPAVRPPPGPAGPVVEAAPLEFDELAQREQAETSAQVKERVDGARALQTARQKETGVLSNAQLTRESLDRFCALNDPCQRLMKGAFDRMGLTARSYDRILRVARTMPTWTAAAASPPPTWLRRCNTGPRSI